MVLPGIPKLAAGEDTLLKPDSDNKLETVPVPQTRPGATEGLPFGTLTSWELPTESDESSICGLCDRCCTTGLMASMAKSSPNGSCEVD